MIVQYKKQKSTSKTNTGEMSDAFMLYKTCYNSVVPITCLDRLLNPQNQCTWFITDIIDNRIIVCTSVHSLLIDATNIASLFFNSFVCDVTGAIEKDSIVPNKLPISISLKVLGVDMSSDFAVLYSIKPGEEDEFNYLGFNFSSKNDMEVIYQW